MVLAIVPLFVLLDTRAGMVEPDSPPEIAFSPHAWLFHEPVVFDRQNDPSLVWLGDGRSLQVIYGTVDWRELAGWQSGRRLTLVYCGTKGTLLHDPATGLDLPVVAGWGPQHPLDRLLQQALDQASSSTDLMLAYHDNTRLWQRELARLQRLYRWILQGRPALTFFEEWQQAAHNYRAAAADFSNAMQEVPGGTLAGLNQAAELNGRLSIQVLELNRHLETFAIAGWWDGSSPPTP